MFSVIESVLRQPLPYRDPERIVWITENTVSGANWLVMAIGSDLEQWRSRAKSLETLRRASSCDGKREIAPQLLPAFGNHR